LDLSLDARLDFETNFTICGTNVQNMHLQAGFGGRASASEAAERTLHGPPAQPTGLFRARPMKRRRSHGHCNFRL
jgi:hypothetical protein